jgi:segregation and condensation protein B
MNELEQKIESLLFFKNEPVSFKWLGKNLEISLGNISNIIKEMSKYYKDRGIVMLVGNDAVSLVTADVSKDLIKDLTNTQGERELSKQALETLSIIAYKGKITKSEIDYIRGVNSIFILRNLLVRGLVSKKQNILDKRASLYVLTHDTLSFLGLTDIQKLPHFQEVSNKLIELEDQFNQDQKLNQDPIVVGE